MDPLFSQYPRLGSVPGHFPARFQAGKARIQQGERRPPDRLPGRRAGRPVQGGKPGAAEKSPPGAGEDLLPGRAAVRPGQHHRLSAGLQHPGPEHEQDRAPDAGLHPGEHRRLPEARPLAGGGQGKEEPVRRLQVLDREPVQAFRPENQRRRDGQQARDAEKPLRAAGGPARRADLRQCHPELQPFPVRRRPGGPGPVSGADRRERGARYRDGAGGDPVALQRPTACGRRLPNFCWPISASPTWSGSRASCRGAKPGSWATGARWSRRSATSC